MDNFTQALAPLFGRRIDTSEVNSFLLSIGVNEQIQIASDDDSTYVTRPAQGFSLLFKDPTATKNPTYAKMPTDAPVLTRCFFYSEGHEGYRQFAGELPGHLSFQDTHEKIHEKLGQPLQQRTHHKSGRLLSERWEIENLAIFITYAKDRDGMVNLSFGIIEHF